MRGRAVWDLRYPWCHKCKKWTNHCLSLSSKKAIISTQLVFMQIALALLQENGFPGVKLVVSSPQGSNSGDSGSIQLRMKRYCHIFRKFLMQKARVISQIDWGFILYITRYNGLFYFYRKWICILEERKTVDKNISMKLTFEINVIDNLFWMFSDYHNFVYIWWTWRLQTRRE
jgi:hypothetical protein